MINFEAKDVFDREALARICTMPERKFARSFGLERFQIDQPAPDDFFLWKDNGSRVLAVAHLDTVGLPHQRAAHFTKTEAGEVVHSRALDDRLGAYIILDMLPRLGLEFDLLLTVGEESGRSTAAFFAEPKPYDWMIEFDRGGTDVVMYQYDDDDTRAAVKASGAKVGDGIFSDICYLEHLGIKGFNWGVGYQDYHGPRAHAYLEDTFDMVDHFQIFHALHAGVRMNHEEEDQATWMANFYGSPVGRRSAMTACNFPRYSWDEEDRPAVLDVDMPDDWDERDPFFVGGEDWMKTRW